LIGAVIAARVNKEFKWKVMRVWWQKPWAEFFLGILVMISALTFGGCPVRTALKAVYLDITAFIGLIMIGVGVFVGCQVLKKLT